MMLLTDRVEPVVSVLWWAFDRVGRLNAAVSFCRYYAALKPVLVLD